MMLRNFVSSAFEGIFSWTAIQIFLLAAWNQKVYVFYYCVLMPMLLKIAYNKSIVHWHRHIITNFHNHNVLCFDWSQFMFLLIMNFKTDFSVSGIKSLFIHNLLMKSGLINLIQFDEAITLKMVFLMGWKIHQVIHHNLPISPPVGTHQSPTLRRIPR